MAEIPKNRLNSTSNLPRTTRRRFSHSEKLRIVEAADRCTKPGELGLLLRREGLFSSHLANWRRWRLRVHPTLAPKNKPQTDSQIRHEKQRLERENARLRLKLEHAEKLLVLQKKMADILDAIDRDERQSSGGKLACALSINTIMRSLLRPRAIRSMSRAQRGIAGARKI